MRHPRLGREPVRRPAYGDEARGAPDRLHAPPFLGARPGVLLAVVSRCEAEPAAQATWLRTRMKEAAPQALVVAS